MLSMSTSRALLTVLIRVRTHIFCKPAKRTLEIKRIKKSYVSLIRPLIFSGDWAGSITPEKRPYHQQSKFPKGSLITILSE